MLVTLILTVLGPDRTGIVDALSSTVTHHGGNWQESQMSRLAGQFAGRVKITCASERASALKASLETLATSGLAISIARENPQTAITQRTRYSLTVLANDRPGILSEVAQLLRAEHANIIEIETRLEPDPKSQDLMFRATATITLADEVQPNQLTSAFEQLSPDLQISLT